MNSVYETRKARQDFDGLGELFSFLFPESGSIYFFMLLGLVAAETIGEGEAYDSAKVHVRPPVLFLTARSAVNDVVEGFELGGNDYLKKPFAIQELIVRIKSLCHRTSAGNISSEEQKGGNVSPDNPDAAGQWLSIGRYRLNVTSQILQLDGKDTELSHRESEILRMLVESKNNVVESKDILLKLWGDDSFFNSRSLHVFITKLRHKLSADENIRIINVRGIGYKMIC